MAKDEKKNNSRWPKLWKWLLVPLVVLLILLAGRWLLQSELLLDYLREMAESEANSQINGSLTIGSLEGDLLHGIQLTDVSIADIDDELLVSADSLIVRYSILNLIWQPHEVDLLAIAGLKVYAEQYADDTWNFETLIPAGPEPVDEEQQGMPFWTIHRFSLERSSIAAISPDFPDGELLIDQLRFLGSAGFGNEGWRVSAEDFQFFLEEDRLVQPVEVGASASLDSEKITLERLIINTGRTFIASRAGAEGDDLMEAQVDLSPLSWLDLRAYSELPLEQDIRGSVGFEGSLENLRFQVDLTANGLGSMMLDGMFHFSDEPHLSRFSARIHNFDGPVLTGDTLSPVVSSVELDGEGNLLLNDLERSRFSGHLSVSETNMNEYTLNQLALDFDWIENQADLQLALNNAGETADGTAAIRNIFSEDPEWNVSFSGNQINLATWLNEPEFDSDLNFNARAEGNGFELSDEVFVIAVSLTESRWGDQGMDRIVFNGSVSGAELAGLLNVEVGDGRISTDFFAENWQTEPVYTFEATMEEFNLAELNGIDEFPTYLNATLTGEGAWFDLENLELTTDIRFDSSFVNNEPIENLYAHLEVRNQVARVTDAGLESEIADADISIRQHLLDFRDPENTLDIDARIRDAGPLAPLFGVETLEASGNFTGRMYRQEQGELQFDGNLSFTEIEYDTLLAVETLEGTINALILEEPEVELNLEILTPSVNGFALQAVNFSTEAVVGDNLLAGSLSIAFLQDEENAVRQAGNFEYTEDNLHLRTTAFSFTSPVRTLSLRNPFDFTWSDQVVRMDTMQIESEDGSAYLILAIPYLDDNRQEVTMDANLLDLGTLQRSFLDEFYAEALMSGEVDFRRENEDTQTRMALLFQEIQYNDGIIDSLKIDATIEEQRLNAMAGAWFEGNELLYVDGDVPFESGDPLTFDDEFFDQPVEGVVRMPPTNLSIWKQFIGEDLELETDGELSFDSRIEGTAGDPVFNGSLSMSEGNLSGVTIDTIGVNIGYSHDTSEIRFDGTVYSLGSRIVDFEALLPLYLDMRELHAELPGDEDEVSVSFFADYFDLAMLNDFLDPSLMRELSGRMSANVELRGTIGSLEPTGNMNLSRGSIRIVPAGITLNEISSSINLTPEALQLESFSMSSGPGRLTANGSVELADMEPGDLGIDLQANQFRVFNTADMNAIVDMRSRLEGSVESPELTGSLQFRSGFVNLENFGEQAVEDVQLEDDPDPMEIVFYDAMSVEMSVEFDRQFFIQNRQYLDMEIELAGAIDMVKQPGSDLELFGTIEGIRGYARPLGRDFDLEEATVTFSGPISNPELNIRTLFNPPQSQEEISIWYIIEGDVEDPEFRFESEPFLELQDIISYTLFGQPFYALESWQQAVSGGGSGTSAADVALELLLDRVELLAAQQLGIDVVEIETDRSGSESSTIIKTGWYLNNKTFFAVLNEISGTSPNTLFQLEYMIRQNLQLIMTQGDDSREGIDLRWEYDY